MCLISIAERGKHSFDGELTPAYQANRILSRGAPSEGCDFLSMRVGVENNRYTYEPIIILRKGDDGIVGCGGDGCTGVGKGIC